MGIGISFQTIETMTTDPTIPRLLGEFRDGSLRALARTISFVEDGRPGFEEILSQLHPQVGSAYRIGITGPPGVGKSTLVERLVRHYRDRGRTVAVVAVDPTSPFTGGALLGDRIRMESVAQEEGVFIRSMATRGAPGGLAITTREVCDVLDAFGFERILIETVGVGQSELAIAGTADTAVLVLVPESGDGVQVLKAGVMEIADLYVVNKSDRPGAEGSEELLEALERHAETMRTSGALSERRRERLVRHTQDVIDRSLKQRVWNDSYGQQRLMDGLDRMLSGALSPYQLAEAIIDAGLRAAKE